METLVDTTLLTQTSSESKSRIWRSLQLMIFWKKCDTLITGSCPCLWSCSGKLKLLFCPLEVEELLYSRKLSSPFLKDENMKWPKILLFSGCICNIWSHVHRALNLWKTVFAYSSELQIYRKKNVVSFPILQTDAVKWWWLLRKKQMRNQQKLSVLATKD